MFGLGDLKLKSQLSEELQPFFGQPLCSLYILDSQPAFESRILIQTQTAALFARQNTAFRCLNGDDQLTALTMRAAITTPRSLPLHRVPDEEPAPTIGAAVSGWRFDGLGLPRLRIYLRNRLAALQMNPLVALAMRTPPPAATIYYRKTLLCR